MYPAFENAGQTAGIEIWRIENFEAIPYAKENYGKFYTGDSYIVLYTKDFKGNFSWDIHFWLGKETSQDEAGSAAIMSVELDDTLGGSPVQHREVQEYESQQFLSYFKSGVRYLPGGVVSGFHHIDPDDVQKRLFQVKGKRNVRVIQVDVDISSMNKGDCFILDAGKDIYVYMGEKSKRTEKLKAIGAANQIRDQDRNGRSKVHVIDQFSTPNEVIQFFEELGSGSPSDVAEENEGGDDANFEVDQENGVALYRVSDSSGDLEVVKVGQKPLHQNMLDSNDSFILDTATSGIFVWIGKGCTKQEKVESLKAAQKFLIFNSRPDWTEVMRIVEGGEPPSFKQYFSRWREQEDQIGLGRAFTIEQIAASLPDDPSLQVEKRDLLMKSGACAIGFMPDDGSGEAEVFRVENFELVPTEPATNGMFFGGDSYVIKYTHGANYRRGYVIYFWQGKDSTSDERIAAAIHAVKLDDELGGKAVQIRVSHGHEPRHFLRIFKGRMIIFLGGKASGFRNLKDHDTYDEDGTRLFQVRGTTEEDVRAEQVQEVAASLRSDSTFVLETPKITYLWVGKDSNEEEKIFAQNSVKLVSPDNEVLCINEGEESEDFWSALGGKGTYEGSSDSALMLIPRLFHCSISATGKLRKEEIYNFKQEDLDEDDVMVLDSGDEIYVWLGVKSTEEEHKLGKRMAEECLKSGRTNRGSDSNIFIIKQGIEPESFKVFFPDWIDNYWESLLPFEEMKKLLIGSD